MLLSTSRASIRRPHRVEFVLDATTRCENEFPIPYRSLKLTHPCDAPDVARGVLAELTEVLERLKIRHFICDGTLLGFVREGGFIQGDNDIDLRLERHAINDDLLDAIRAAGFSLLRRDWINGKQVNVALRKQGIAIDLMGTDFQPGQTVFHIGHYPRGILSYRQPFHGVEKRDFDGLSLWLPQNPEIELAANYGPDWRTPARHWHSHFSLQGLYRCTGSFKALVLCAFNLQECQRCLNGGNPKVRPWSLAELAGVASSLAGIKPKSRLA